MLQNRLFLFFYFFSFILFSQVEYKKEYYENDQLKEEGWLIENKKNGYWITYNSNNII